MRDWRSGKLPRRPKPSAPPSRGRSTAAIGAGREELISVRTPGGASSTRAAIMGRGAGKGLGEAHDDDDDNNDDSGSDDAAVNGNSEETSSDSKSVSGKEGGGRPARHRAALTSLVRKEQETKLPPGNRRISHTSAAKPRAEKAPSETTTRVGRELFQISNQEAWTAPTRQIHELSGWNQEQLETLKRSERRRWSALLTLTLEAERGELDDTWMDRLEDAAAAFSFMVYHYCTYIKPTLGRQMLGHRQIINTFASERESRSSPASFRAALDGNSDRPFNPEERRYIDGSKANDPLREG